jgi:hypothetical protein
MTETIVAFCPSCGRYGEHAVVNHDKLLCRHCRAIADIPDEAWDDPEALEPEAFDD